MFTPQQKGPSRWSVSPSIREGVDNGSAANPRAGTALALGKGKGKMVAEPPPPPQMSLGDDPRGRDDSGSGDPLVWRRFREAGMLDESSLQRKDREALAQRVSELEKELYEYQYNMGLLLIEKKDWTSNYDEVRQALAEVNETLKREQTAHVVAISELETHEENLRKALGVEKQCVADLEKALREMRSEIAEVKFTSERKLDEARALETGLEEKYLEIESKLHSADARLAEASRKGAEIDRKLEDVEARERKFQKDYQSLISERKMHEKDLIEQREHLHKWEEKLHEGQKRFVEGQRLLNEREDRANEADKFLKKKETEIEENRKKIEDMNRSLKMQEEDITTRLSSLVAKEMETDVKVKNLELKEEELSSREEKLNAREKVEIQKLLDDHNTMLDSKRQEFELDLEKRRKVLEQEFRSKMDRVEKTQKEVECKENEIVKREENLQVDMQKLRDIQKDLDSKSKALKMWEESVKSDEVKLEKEKQQLCRDLEGLQKSKSELESLMASIEAGKEQILKEEKILTLTKEEREEHLLLQSKLKEEIKDCTVMKESLFRDAEDLKQQREKFEAEWETLDEKRSALELDMKKFSDEKERFEKWRHSEEERFKNEALAVKVNTERELEELGQKKESFEKTMEHERSDALEVLKRERADMVRELELRKHDLEMDMHKRLEDMERNFYDRQNEFERKRDVELQHIKSLSNETDTKLQKLKMEQDQIERERENLALLKKKLEIEQQEIRMDIDTLQTLSETLKVQREEFMKERNEFLALAKQCKLCKNCGHPFGDLELTGLQHAGNVELPTLVFEGNLKGKSVETSPYIKGSQSVGSTGRTSWLQKCSKLFSFSPEKKTENLSAKLDREALDGVATQGPGESSGFAVNSSGVAQDDNEIREKEKSEGLGDAGEEIELSLGVADNSIDVPTEMVNGNRKKVGNELILPSDENEKEASSIQPQGDYLPEPSKQGRKTSKRGRAKAIRRNRSVKAVVEEARTLLGGTSNEKTDGQLNSKDSMSVQEDSLEDSVQADTTTSAGNKRRISQAFAAEPNELDVEGSEARSDSVSLGGPYKRRHTSALVTQNPGEKRYNFRRSTVNKTSGLEKPSRNDKPKHNDEDGEGTSKPSAEAASKIMAYDIQVSHALQQKPVESVAEVQEISSQKLVRFEMEETHDIVVESPEFSQQTGDDEFVVVDGAAADEAEVGTPDGSSSEDEDDDSEKHNASIGKKLWNFFTT